MAEGVIVSNDAIVAEADDGSQVDTESVLSSSTASLSESISSYRKIHGRTYTQKTDYWGPNDTRQNDGLEIAHYMETLFFDNRLFLAPIGDDPGNVLDLGTGTGIWAIDFADEFPSADVTGVDISPIQPGWVPPNCRFQIDDIEQPWTFTQSFDFIHVRHLEASIKDWAKLYKQAFQNLKPGGHFEIKEFDIEDRSQAYGDDLPESHIYRRWAKLFFEATERFGKSMDQTRNNGIAKALKTAGFVDIVEKRFTIPVGGWPADPRLKEIGEINLEYIDQSLEGFAVFLLKEIMGWEYTAIQVFIMEMRKALKDPKLQSILYLYVVYARKPEASDEL